MDRKKGTVDHTLLILVVILLLFGLTVLLSTSAYNGQVKFSDPASYFKKQLFATVLGIWQQNWIITGWKNGEWRRICCRLFCLPWYFLWELPSMDPDGG